MNTTPPNSSDIEDIKRFLLGLQARCVKTLSAWEPKKNILKDSWQRKKNRQQKLYGEGLSIFIEGDVIERGGINFSHVQGKSLPPSASLIRQQLVGKPFQALGISIVMHPDNPFIPTAHANVRFFKVQESEKARQDANNATHEKNGWWFGGGFDLTPYYPVDEDIIYWHQQAKKCCQPYGKEIYSLFKQQCDHYFHLKHRNETRGVGGLFFDDLNKQSGWPFDQAFQFIQQVGNTFLESYACLIERHHQTPFTQKQKDFQLYRRGRYVEFNLLYDRGTIFGLQSGGRTESILMSMPKNVRWQYNYHPEPNTPESRLSDYLKPREWL